jgi:hypothetical protein
MSRFRNLLAVVCVLPLLVIGLGCYETQYPLGSADTATVDPSYVGDYVFTDGDKANTIVIRNIDNHQYYVEWIGGEQKGPDRMVGYTADVNGVAFANLRGLTDDGSIDNKFLVMRISLSPDHAKLTLRNLKDDFFKDKNINSSESLGKVIAANLENEQMYDGESVVATRVTPPSTTPSAMPNM